MTQSVEKTLAEYEELLAQRDVIALDIPAAVRIQLSSIDEEFEDKLKTVDAKIAAYKKILQDQVKLSGQRVDGRQIQVIYQKPSWRIKDLVRLLQLAISTPEILECLERSEPVARVQVIQGR